MRNINHPILLFFNNLKTKFNLQPICGHKKVINNVVKSGEKW